MTQIYLHPYRPEMGDRRPLRKLAGNYRAQYHQYQSAEEIKTASANGRWVGLDSARPGSVSVHRAPWVDWMDEHYARLEGLHIVTGSMNHGLPKDVLDLMDFNVHVPQFDDVPFLAPASAVAIALQEVFQQVANRQGVWG